MSFNSFEPACKEYCRGLSAEGKAAIQKRKDAAAAAAAAKTAPPDTQAQPDTTTEPDTSAPPASASEDVPAAGATAGVLPTQSAGSVPTAKSAGGVSETKSAGDSVVAKSIGSNRSGSGGATAHDGAAAQGAPTTSPSKSAKGGDPTATESQMQRVDSIVSNSYVFVEGEDELDLNTMFMDLLKHPYTKKILAAAALFILGVKLAKELDFLYMPLRIYDPLKSGALGKML